MIHPAVLRKRLKLPAHERARLANRTRWRDYLWKRVDYDPHPKQDEVHTAISGGAIYIILDWGRRTGKSVMGAAEILPEMAFSQVAGLPKRLINTSGPEFDITDRVFGHLWKWIVDDRVFGVKPPYKSARQRYIEMPWGARLEGKTTEQPRSLLGDGLVLHVADEHARNKPGILQQYILPPTFDTGGIVILISTPQGLLNHFKSTWDEWGERIAVNPRYFRSHATSYDNPHLDHAKIDEYREECIKNGLYELFLQEVMAEFTSIAGAVYPMFSAQQEGEPWHVRDFEPDRDLPIYLGIDWGDDHPFVVLFAQVWDGDRLMVFDMISEREADPLQQLRMVKDRLAHWNLECEMAYCDPSGASMKRLFSNADIPVFNPSDVMRLRINAIQDGVTEVKKIFSRPIRPGCVIHTSCDKLIAGIQSYVWNDKTGKPVKEKDDECDAFRYLVMGLFGSRTGSAPLIFHF